MTQTSHSEDMLVKAYRRLKKSWTKSTDDIVSSYDGELQDFFDEFEAHYYSHFPLGN